MTRKKIIIIADSVSMPRPGVPYEDTWIYRIKKEFPHYDFIDRSARGSNSARLVTEGGGGADLLESYRPHMVILQFGMADCAPRLFDKKSMEYRLVSRVLPGGLRTRYIDHVKKHRVRNPGITDISPEGFRNNVTAYLERARSISAKVIIIPILPPSEEYMRKSPHVRENVDHYNEIFREAARKFPHVRIVEPFLNEADMSGIWVDELHIGAKGAEIIFSALKHVF